MTLSIRNPKSISFLTLIDDFTKVSNKNCARKWVRLFHGENSLGNKTKLHMWAFLSIVGTSVLYFGCIVNYSECIFFCFACKMDKGHSISGIQIWKMYLLNWEWNDFLKWKFITKLVSMVFNYVVFIGKHLYVNNWEIKDIPYRINIRT